MTEFSKIMNKHTLLNWRVSTIVNLLVLIFLIAGIILGCAACIAQYQTIRPLWLDEATIARSVLSRDFATLVSSPLDWGQSAPIGYLYTVKLSSHAFGYGDGALRLFSLLCWLGVVCLLWRMGRTVFQCSISATLFAIFIFVTNAFYMRYAHELKPYMNDNFWILLVLYMFWRYWYGKLKPWQFSIVCAVAYMFSMASAFAIAASYALILARLIRTYWSHGPSRNMTTELLSIVPLAMIGSVITLCWVLPATYNAGGKGYFELWKFPLLPLSSNEFEAWWVMVRRISLYSGLIFWGALLLAGSGLFFAIKRSGRNRCTVICAALTILFTLIASNRGLYPIEARLIQFILLLLIVIAMYGYEELTLAWKTKSLCGKIASYILGAVLLFGASLSIDDDKLGNVWKQYESACKTKPGDGYLKPYRLMVQGGDKVQALYLGQGAEPAYLWLKAYYGDKCGVTPEYAWHKNTKHGPRLFKMSHDIKNPYNKGKILQNQVDESLKWLKKYKTAYILLSHDKPDIVPFLKELGEVKVLHRNYGIELYQFAWKEANFPQ